MNSLLIANKNFEVQYLLGNASVTQQLTFLSYSPSGSFATFAHPAPHTVSMVATARPQVNADGTRPMELDPKLGMVPKMWFTYKPKEVKTLSIPCKNIQKAVMLA